MEIGTFVMRRLAGPFVGRAIPTARAARARFSRGRCFGIPRGKTYILIPETLDYESARQITAMLDRFWFLEGRDWEVVRVGHDGALNDTVRRGNLIILGGPDQNPAANEVMREHPDLLRSVRYHGGAGPEWRWQDHAFRADGNTDFALLCIRRNVLADAPGRRLVLIFGLGDAGTLAAARLYAGDDYASERRALQRELGTLRGELEVLLHVTRSADGKVHRVRAARRNDGAPAPALLSARTHLLTPHRESLARIYESLEQHRRRVVLSDLCFVLTVTRDYALRMQEEVTIGAERQDVVVITKALWGTPLAADEDIEFTTDADGDDEQVFLPAEVLETERRFLLFPLPPLIAGGAARRIRIGAVWPRACLALQRPGGEDVNAIAVSDHAGPNVDQVTVTIRFEVQDATFQVFERFSLEKVVPDASARRGQAFGIHSPYHLRLADVRPGTTLEFRIVRVP
jgi:hypothetical protein